MAANLGQAFMGSGGMIPSLAQELASSNFHESRESFHDYIYSKLILGEEKGGTPSLAHSSISNPPVFPNTNLSSSYPNPVGAAATTASAGTPSNAFTQASNSSAFASPALTTPVTPKPSSSKKKSSHHHHHPQQHQQQHLQQQQQQQQQPHALNSQNAGPIPQSLTPNVEGVDGATPKPKKKSHHKKKDKTNICDVCGRGFAEKYTLNRHMLTHTNIKPYSCSKCNMAFSRSDGLAKHMAAGHRRIDAHHCDVCGGTFNSEVSFEQHRREYGSTLPFVCNLCMLAFSQCCHLNYHMKSHSLNKLNDSVGSENQDDKSNAIDISELIPEDFTPPKSTTSSQKDSLHLSGIFNFSSGNKAIDQVLKRNADGSLPLMDPNITIKPEIEDMPSCSGGSSSAGGGGAVTPFDALNNLSAVVNSVAAGALGSVSNPISLTSGGLNIPTSQSGSGFPPEGAHVNSSGSGVGNNPPPISDLEMKKYFDIKIPNPRYMEGAGSPGAGTGEDGLFHCELCGKGFTRKYHMQRHVKLHTRGPVPRAHLLDWTRRPYACGVCKMGFTRQHHLTRHMLIHTGERPHACHVCGKAFRRFTNLSLHVRTVHGAERPFKCPVCGRGFPRLYSLQRHIKLHTKELEARAKGLSGEGYSDFKAVGTIDRNNSTSKSPVGGSDKNSPAHSRESISSENSDIADKYEQGLTPQADRSTVDLTREESVPKDLNSPIQRNGSEAGYSQQNLVHSHSGEGQNARGGQNTARLQQQQQNLLPNQTVIEVVNQHSRILGQSSESVGRHGNQSQARSVGDFNNQAMPQTSAGDQRFSTPNPPIQNPNLRALELSTGRANFNEMDLRESQGYSLNQQQQQQQQGNSDRFSMHPSRIQSPHPLMSNMDRPSSRGILNQPSPHPHDNPAFNPHGAGSFPQQSRGGGDRNTVSPATIRGEPANFAHSQRVDPLQGSGRAAMNLELQAAGHGALNMNMDLSSSSRAAMERVMNAELQGNARSGLSDPPAYTLPHTVSSLQFGSASHGVYQQAVSETLSRMELHAAQVSPMPLNPHQHSNNNNNNLPY